MKTKIHVFAVISYTAVMLFVYLITTKIGSNSSVLVNLQAIAIIFGGLIVSGLASYPLATIQSAYRHLKSAFTDTPSAPVSEAQVLVKLARSAGTRFELLRKEWRLLEYPFMKEALGLVLEGLPRPTVEKILRARVEESMTSYQTSAGLFLTLGKYAPALGLAATVLGLIELLADLGAADLQKMGMGMAIALSATFYGIITANLLLTPLAEFITALSERRKNTDEMIIEAVLAMMDHEHPLIVGERVNSYLPEAHRISFIQEASSVGQDSSEWRMSA